MKHFKTTDEKAIGFWTIVTNILLVLFTFWLGIVVQSMVAQKNATVSSTLANIEYVEKVKPLVDSLNVKYGPMLMDFSSLASGKDKNGKSMFTDSDTKRAEDHYNLYCNTYADFFNDLAYTFAQIYKFDHNCPSMIRTAASCLPILSPMIKYISSVQQLEQKNDDTNRRCFEDTINSIFRAPSYIESFGFMIGNFDETMNMILQLYDAAVKSNDNKNNLIIISETYALLVYRWISEHTYYTPPKDTSLIGRISDNLGLSFFVFAIIGLIVAWIVYRLHKWSSPTPKESDIHLKKTANNLEEMRKDTSVYRKDLAKALANIEVNIANVQDKLSVLAAPVYDKLYDQEYECARKMIEAIRSSEKENGMPKYEENRFLYGERKYNEIAEYVKQLEEYMNREGICLT